MSSRFLRGSGLCILFVSLVGGCGLVSSPSESVDRATRSLEAVEVSPVFEIEAPPPTFPAASHATIACGPSLCLLAQDAPQPGGEVVSTERIAFDGTRLDAVPRWTKNTALASSSSFPFLGTVAPLGEDFVVSVSIRGELQRRLVRVSGTDGSILGDIATLPRYVEFLAGDGTSLLIVHRDSGISRGRVWSASTLQPLGPEFDVPFNPWRIVVGGGRYLILDGSKFQRVDATTGAALDATPVLYNRYLSAGIPDGVAIDGTFLVGFVASTTGLIGDFDVYATRILADGTVVDADNTFDELPGAKVVCDACAFAGGFELTDLSVERSGDDAVFVFARDDFTSTGRPRLAAMRVDPTTAAPVDGSFAQPESDLSAEVVEFDVRLHDSVGFVVSRVDGYSTIRSIGVSPAPYPYAVGAPRAIAFNAEVRRDPAVASNGTDFLVVFQSNNVGLRATRIDGSTGEYRDDPALALEPSYKFALGSNGTDYLVVSVNDTAYGTPFDLRTQVVRSNGVVEPVATSTDHIWTSDSRLDGFHVAWSGEYYLVTWIVDGVAYGRRIDADGALLGSSDIIFGDSADTLGVIADRPADVAMSTFAVALTGVGGIRRLRSHSGSLIMASTPLDPVYAFSVFGGASDGTDVVFGWSAGTNDGDRLGRFETLTGAAIGSTVDVGRTSGSSDVHWNGRSYVATKFLRVGPELRYVMHRFDASLEPRDAPLGTTGRTIFQVDEHYLTPVHSPAIAGRGDGRSLLVLVEPSEERRTMRITGRFIDDTGLATEPPASDAGVDAGGTSGTSDAGVDAGGTSGTSDAGVDAGGTSGPSDAGVDAGGTSGPSDAGADGGTDSGGPVDAATDDAGSDAGSVPNDDAAVEHDAGEEIDAGADSGSVDDETDAGATIDAGFVAMDGGTPRPRGGGCSVSVGRSSGTAVQVACAALVVALLGLRRAGRRTDVA